MELHGANGYLVDSFLRDGSDRRGDRYGGSVEDRTRFLAEVTEALVDVRGAERVGVRLSPLNSFNDMEDSRPEPTFPYAACRLGELGIAYLHIVEPDPDTFYGGDETGYTDYPFWEESGDARAVGTRGLIV